MKMLTYIPVELIFWVAALTGLFLAEPEVQKHMDHFTLCPLANLGMTWCPGCGIGRSITQLLHGNLEASLAFHWFGIPALVIILCRIWSLLAWHMKNYKEYKLI